MAVYICTGCDIGEALDIDELESAASEHCDLCRTHGALCGAEGRALIAKDMAEEGVNAAVIAGCSPRVYEREFNALGLPVLERANLREQVVWCHEPNDEDTQMLAQDAIIMACAKAKRVEPCED